MFLVVVIALAHQYVMFAWMRVQLMFLHLALLLVRLLLLLMVLLLFPLSAAGVLLYVMMTLRPLACVIAGAVGVPVPKLQGQPYWLHSACDDSIATQHSF